MTDDRLHDVGARAEHADEIGWESPDWAAVLRRHRRRQAAVGAGMVAFICVVVPLVRLVVQDRPLSLMYWLWLLITIIYVGEAISSRVTADGRAQWERETRQKVRISHAIRHHVGIGVRDRSLVTERARSIATWSKVAFVGWPLLAAALVARRLEVGDLPASLILLVSVVCLLLVARAVHRARQARRWLADPLPRDEQTA